MNKIVFIFLLLFLGCAQSAKQENREEMDLAKIKALADSCYEGNNYARARTYFDKLIQSDSLSGVMFYKRGYCNAQLLDFEKSSKDYLKAVHLGYRVSDAYYNLGLNQIPSLNDSLAIFYLEESLKLNPNAPEVISALEACRKRLSKPEKERSSKI